MTRAEAVLDPADVIRPVRWWTVRPMFGIPDESRLRRFPDGISRRGPFHIAELEAIAVDAAESSEARYVAMGYLAALHNAGCLATDRVVAFLEGVARAATAPAHWFCRRNALDALAHLRDGAATHPRAMARLVALAGDREFEPGRRDARSALATTGDPRALAPLAVWVAELAEGDEGDEGATGGERADGDDGEPATERWPPRWRDTARMFVQCLAGGALGAEAIDAAAIMAPLASPGAVPGCARDAREFLLEAVLRFSHDDRMLGILAALAAASRSAEPRRTMRGRVISLARGSWYGGTGDDRPGTARARLDGAGGPRGARRRLPAR